jgi:hypothetical protein
MMKGEVILDTLQFKKKYQVKKSMIVGLKKEGSIFHRVCAPCFRLNSFRIGTSFE